jgi:hypothetical protein
MTKRVFNYKLHQQLKKERDDGIGELSKLMRG